MTANATTSSARRVERLLRRDAPFGRVAASVRMGRLPNAVRKEGDALISGRSNERYPGLGTVSRHGRRIDLGNHVLTARVFEVKQGRCACLPLILGDGQRLACCACRLARRGGTIVGRAERCQGVLDIASAGANGCDRLRRSLAIVRFSLAYLSGPRSTVVDDPRQRGTCRP